MKDINLKLKYHIKKILPKKNYFMRFWGFIGNQHLNYIKI